MKFRPKGGGAVVGRVNREGSMTGYRMAYIYPGETVQCLVPYTIYNALNSRKNFLRAPSFKLRTAVGGGVA